MLNKILQSPLLRVAARFGAISGVLVMIFIVSLYYMEKHPYLINPFLDPRIPVIAVMLLFALKEIRDLHQSGTLYFGQGMVAGFVMTLVCAALSWMGIWVFATLEPGFVSEFIRLATEQTKSFSPEDIDRIGRETFEQGLAELKKADKYFMASRYFFQTFIISFFVSIIVSIVLRRTSVEV